MVSPIYCVKYIPQLSLSNHCLVAEHLELVPSKALVRGSIPALASPFAALGMEQTMENSKKYFRKLTNFISYPMYFDALRTNINSKNKKMPYIVPMASKLECPVLRPNDH